MFNLSIYPDKEKFPTVSYSSKKKCINTYIECHKKFGESVEKPYVKMEPLMKDIFKLYDYIEVNIAKYYKEKYVSGKCSSIKGVTPARRGECFKSRFLKNNIEYLTPTGFIYPILGSFRALMQEEDGKYKWIKILIL